jgi:hypothetical protein
VSEQRLARGRCRREFSSVENHVLPNGIRLGSHKPRGRRGLGIRVHSHFPDIGAPARLHELACGSIEGLAWRAQHLVYKRRRVARFLPARGRLRHAGVQQALRALVAESLMQRVPQGAPSGRCDVIADLPRPRTRGFARLITGPASHLSLHVRSLYARCACATQAKGCGPCGTFEATSSMVQVPAGGLLTRMTSTLFVASSPVEPGVA